MEKMAGCPVGLSKSNITQRGKDTMQRHADIAKRGEFIGGAADTSNSHAESSTTCSIPDAVRKIIWEFWRVGGTQAEYRYRGAPLEYDLGDIDR